MKTKLATLVCFLLIYALNVHGNEERFKLIQTLGLRDFFNEYPDYALPSIALPLESESTVKSENNHEAAEIFLREITSFEEEIYSERYDLQVSDLAFLNLLYRSVSTNEGYGNSVFQEAITSLSLKVAISLAKTDRKTFAADSFRSIEHGVPSDSIPSVLLESFSRNHGDSVSQEELSQVETESLPIFITSISKIKTRTTLLIPSYEAMLSYDQPLNMIGAAKNNVTLRYVLLVLRYLEINDLKLPETHNSRSHDFITTIGHGHKPLEKYRDDFGSVIDYDLAYEVLSEPIPRDFLRVGSLSFDTKQFLNFE